VGAAKYFSEIVTAFSQKRSYAALGILAAVLLAFGLAAPNNLDSDTEGGWYSVLPPLVAVTFAMITRRLLFSLFSAIVIGGFLSEVVRSPQDLGTYGTGLVAGVGFVWSALIDPATIQILAFVILVMSMIALIIAAGGLHALVTWCARFSAGRKSTKMMTAILGLLIFFDDYANTMIVGSSMRPMTDKYRISREKLAFLVDATAAPVAGIAIISTWIGYEVGLFGEVGKNLSIATDGYGMFFDAIAYRFYCFMMLIFVFTNILTRRDFGPMLKAERRAIRTGKVIAKGSKPLTSETYTQVSPFTKALKFKTTAIFPIFTLLFIFIGGIWIDGGGNEHLQRSGWNIMSLTVWKDVISEAENNILILTYASLISLLCAILCSFGLARLDWNSIQVSIMKGAKGALLPSAILLMAFSLKGTCDSLHTGAFLVKTVGTVLSPIWFPVLIFSVAGFTAFATGTSWGTMAILIPTAVPIAYQLDGSMYGITTIITLGAVLDGAIAGDHCSPISDTTLLSSIASSCDLIDHVKTQMPYTLLVAVIALLTGYLPAALGVPSVICIFMGGAAIFLWLRFVGKKLKYSG